MPGAGLPPSRTQMAKGAACVLLLSLLLMVPLLWTAPRRLLSVLATATAASSSMAAAASGSGPAAAAAAPSYAPGAVSAAFVTCPNQTVAKDIARAVVEKRLAACVNIVPQITSIYEWKGKIEEDSEVLLMIKTRTSRVPALAEFVRSVHPYEVAEVIAVPIQQGNPPYLQWVEEMVPEKEQE